MDKVDERALEDAQAFKEIVDGWWASVTKATSEPLRIKDGQIISGTLWIGLAQPEGKPKRKPVAARGTALQKWALKIASQPYDYAA